MVILLKREVEMTIMSAVDQLAYMASQMHTYSRNIVLEKKKKTWYIFVLLAPYVCFRVFGWVKVTEWPPIGKIAGSFGLRCVFMV